MELIFSSLQTALSNLIIFLIIPFLCWLFKHRKETTFFKPAGFVKPQLRYKWWDWIVFAAAYFICNSGIIPWIFGGAEENSTDMLVVGIYTGIGATAIVPSLIEDFISNGFCEELFFRGFLCKRLSKKFGITAGIILQAIAFGLLHNLIYIFVGVEIGLNGHLVLFIGMFFAGIAFAVLNECLFNGSIIPSILLHGVGNFSSSISEAFGWADKFGIYSAYIITVLSIVMAVIAARNKKEAD